MAFDRDKKWVMWEHENVKFWNGETLRVLEGATLIHLGGHFAGGQVLHWAEGVGGKGALFTGDILQVSSIATSGQVIITVGHTIGLISTLKTLEIILLVHAHYLPTPMVFHIRGPCYG